MFYGLMTSALPLSQGTGLVHQSALVTQSRYAFSDHVSVHSASVGPVFNGLVGVSVDTSLNDFVHVGVQADVNWAVVMGGGRVAPRLTLGTPRRNLTVGGNAFVLASPYADHPWLRAMPFVAGAWELDPRFDLRGGRWTVVTESHVFAMDGDPYLATLVAGRWQRGPWAVDAGLVGLYPLGDDEAVPLPWLGASYRWGDTIAG